MNVMVGKVVAVSVASPRWQEMYGRQVFSSIVREPAEGALQFTPGGPEGNETAVHTEEVFAFFAEHYDYWAEELAVNRATWGDCHWGENLMLAGGFREELLHVGDRFRIGAALLEVTSPRIPCFKLSWRLGQDESFLGKLVASGLMGCYFRVIEPGPIQAGDQARREFHAADATSVLQLSRLLHDPASTDVSVLRRILATPGLGSQASEMLRKRINALTDGQLPARDRWTGWREFTIENVRQEATGIKSFWLAPSDGGPIGGYRAGQFLTVRLPDDAGGHVRSWSISDYDQDSRHYRLSIKHEPEGRASRWMNEDVVAGTRVDVRPPAGRFMLDRGSFLRTVMISAGIGVTPMVAMLKAHVERGDEAPPLLWLHSARSSTKHAFALEVDAALAKLPSAVRRIFYSQPAPKDRQGIDYDFAGRIDAGVIRQALSESYKLAPFGRELELTGDNADFYLCGPRAFEDGVKQALIAAGVNPAAIRSESFGPAGEPDDALPTPERATIIFARSGKAVEWSRDEYLTLLELAEREGIELESSCRMGTCGTCEIPLLAGELGYVVKPAADPASGRVLTCCAVPLSANLTLDA